MARRRPKPPTPEELAAAAEAQEFLQRYLATAPDSLQRLRDRSAATGGPTPDELDLSRDSLVPLFEWAMGQFRLRPSDEPTDFIDKGDLGRYYQPRGGVQPIWFGRTGLHAPGWWDDDTLVLIDALAFYFAEALMRAIPEAHWEAGHDPNAKRWIHENQPVIVGAGPAFEPLQHMFHLAGGIHRYVNPDAPNPYNRKPATTTDLRDLYDGYVKWYASERSRA
jgi:hypothetical protein